METTDRMRFFLERVAAEFEEEFGPVMQGEHGCWLESIEDWAVLLGDELSRRAMARQVGTVLSAPAAREESVCPKCDQQGASKGHRKRRIETRRGPIHVDEPEYYCPRCRRSFFPPDARVGHGT
jgi:hypothetical protein